MKQKISLELKRAISVLSNTTFSDLQLTSPPKKDFMVKSLLAAACILMFLSCEKNPPGDNIKSVQDSLTENSKATNPHSPKYIPQVKIGKQTWTLLNLDVSTYANGDPIPQVTDPAQWVALTTGAWCYYNNDPAIGAIYGKLYNWYAVADTRGLAPKGWHVANNSDWATLTAYLGGWEVAGDAMKETGCAHWLCGTDLNVTNSSGWTGLAGGSRFPTEFAYLLYDAVWWSATEDDASHAGGRGLNYISGTLGTTSEFKNMGLYVRCVKN